MPTYIGNPQPSWLFIAQEKFQRQCNHPIKVRHLDGWPITLPRGVWSTCRGVVGAPAPLKIPDNYRLRVFTPKPTTMGVSALPSYNFSFPLTKKSVHSLPPCYHAFAHTKHFDTTKLFINLNHNQIKTI